MSAVEARLREMGLSLPAPIQVPAGLHLPFAFVNRRGDRAVFSGHAAQDSEGRIAGPFGVVGRDLSTEAAAEGARDIALSALANLKAAIGGLDRVAGWVRVFGMVNSAPSYSKQHLVLNGFSDLVIAAFGPDVGRHARSAMGAEGMPLNFAIEVESEVFLT